MADNKESTNSAGDSSTSADQLEKSIVTIQTYVHSTVTSLNTYKRINKILTLLILVILGSFGVTIYWIARQNFSEKKLQMAIENEMAGSKAELMTKMQNVWASEHPKIMATITKEGNALKSEVMTKLTTMLDSAKNDPAVVEELMKPFVDDHIRILRNVFPELKTDDDVNHIIGLLENRLAEENEIITDTLLNSYMVRLDDLGQLVTKMGAKKFPNKTAEELQTDIVHFGLLLIDHEYMNHRYEDKNKESLFFKIMQTGDDMIDEGGLK